MPVVLDGNSSLTIGVIGIVPMVVSMLAQATDSGVGVTLAPWTNLAAVTVIVGLFAWLLTKHIPAREQRAEERQDARDKLNQDRLDRIQQEFLAALKMREETSRVAAQMGQNSMQAIVQGQHDMMTTIDEACESLKGIDKGQAEVCKKLEELAKAMPGGGLK